MENVLLVDCVLNKSNIQTKHLEMLNLLSSLEITPTFFIKQELTEPYVKTYLGSGKIQEIKMLIEINNIELVVFNFDLTPTQYSNLKHILKVEIIDRTGVILLIFSQRAKSKEARLQAEIANFKYLKSRLVEKDANYSQVTSGGGLRNRGSGEKQIDLDRSKYKVLLKRKEKELKELVLQRKNTRSNREHYPLFAIVGYTNAGKSTLLNSLIKKSNNKQSKSVLQEDRLFATLETATRLISYFPYPHFLITDTVGFISDLPTMLVEAFKSTLEEIKEADVLIHVVDISNENYLKQIYVTNEILSDLGCGDIPVIYLYNKVDKCKALPFIPKANELFISLNSDEYIEQIFRLMFEQIKEKWDYFKYEIPFNPNIYNIYKYAYVTHMIHYEEYFVVEGYCPTYNKHKIKECLCV